MSDKTVPAKPLAGLAIVLFVATVIGGWLYVDNVRNELEAKIQSLESQQTAQPIPQGTPAVQTETPPAAPTSAAKEGWSPYTNSQLGFSIMIPDTHRVVEASDHVIIVMKPTSENDTPVPDMVVRMTSTAAAEQYPGTMIQKGAKTFWLYTWENFDWPPSAEVIASFKAL